MVTLKDMLRHHFSVAIEVAQVPYEIRHQEGVHVCYMVLMLQTVENCRICSFGGTIIIIIP